jgi:DMSO/TMAO reductase YedYZ molybdopterin-dependent catalytic subunit
MAVVTRGFTGRGRRDVNVPPGQYLTEDFPVLSAGPTPRIDLGTWQLGVTTETGQRRTWSWPEFLALPSEEFTVDLHCVTKWSKLGTPWRGVRIGTLLADVETAADFVMAHSYGGYTTNVPLEDLLDGSATAAGTAPRAGDEPGASTDQDGAWIAYEYDGAPLPAEHGGPARLLVPHLYLWKSAKWVRELQLMPDDEPGFWESGGYHMYGDPWREQRYWGD